MPPIIGPALMSQYNLNPLETGTFTGYDSTQYPQIINEFTTAAFRYGHGMVPSQMLKADPNWNTFATFNLTDLSFSPQQAYVNGGLDALCRGTIINPNLMPDAHFGDQLANHLFDVGIKIGNNSKFSLNMINVQRGRDHGLLPYNQYRSMAGLNTAKTFSDLSTNIGAEQIANLQSVYENVNDIDLFAGGMTEEILSGAMVGQTFGCKSTKKCVFFFSIF